MARSQFGGNYCFPTSAAAVGPSLDPGTVWTAQTGGTQITDLLTMSDQPITTLTTALCAPNGFVQFQGPPNGTTAVWVQTSAPARIRMVAESIVPIFGSGYDPGFAVEGNTLDVDGFVVWNFAYQIDDITQSGTDEAVDDEWFTWDPEDDPHILLVKRPGFYLLRRVVRATDDPADPWAVRVSVPNFGVIDPILGGMARVGSFSSEAASVFAVRANSQVKLLVDPGDNILTLDSAAMILVPLFN